MCFGGLSVVVVLLLVLLAACSGSAGDKDVTGEDPGETRSGDVLDEARTGPDVSDPDSQPLDQVTEQVGEVTLDLLVDLADVPEVDADVDPDPDVQPEHVEETHQPDVVCHAPSFSEDCSLVTQFQCGFYATCKDGVLMADWHHHWFCDEQEEITGFVCSFECPHGCTEGDIMDWPQDGAALVEQYCHECAKPQDCSGDPPVNCVGYWDCKAGSCIWECGICLGVGEQYMGYEPEHGCCPGLVAKDDCEYMNGICSCPKCLCFICLDCGDGVCDESVEHPCNCPEDCGTPPVCVKTKRSACDESLDPYNMDDPHGEMILTLDEGGIFLEHRETVTNCCAELQFCYSILGSEIRVESRIVEPYMPCLCNCVYTFTGLLEGVPSGTWTVTLTSEASPDLLLSETVIVP
jgi:hypothetical protein